MQDLTKTVDGRILSTFRYDQAMVAKLIDGVSSLAVNLIVAAVIVLVTVWAARWISGLVRRAVDRLQGHPGADATLPSFVASSVRYLVLIIGLVAVLQRLGVQTTSIIAVLGAASLAVGLALQGALSNVAAGVMILLLRPYRVGDTIETLGRKGVVRSLDLFVTELSTADNLRIVVPNGKVFGDVIVNHSNHSRRRADAVFKLPVAADLEMVISRLRERIAADPRVRAEPAPNIEVVGHAHDSVEIAVRAWTTTEDESGVKSDILRAAHQLALDPAGEAPPLTPSAPRPKPSKRAEHRLSLRLGKGPR